MNKKYTQYFSWRYFSQVLQWKHISSTKNARKEKRYVAFTESCRLMQGSIKAYLFRSGAADEESDGFARYSEHEMAQVNLGGTAR